MEAGMPSLPPVAVVIPHYRHRELLLACLDSLMASRYPDLSIIVVDNGGTLSPGNLPVGVLLLTPDKNIGYAGACNEGFAHTEAPFVVFLNDDTLVHPEWLGHLVGAALVHPEAAALQPKLLSLPEHRNGREVFDYAGAAGGRLNLLGYPSCFGRNFIGCEEDRGQYDQERTIDWASGAAFFVRSQAFEEQGGFDREFFMHMEEIDLCWRLRRAGWSIRSVPRAVVWHEGGASLAAASAEKAYLNHRNNLRMIRKNRRGAALALTLLLRLPLELAAACYYLTTRPNGPAKARAVLRALGDAQGDAPTPPRSRVICRRGARRGR